MIGVGVVGLGFMGVTHFNCWKKVRGAKVVAISDPDPDRLSGNWKTVGNLGITAERQDLTGIAQYAGAADLFADPKVDLVDICLPTFLHAERACAALAAGKHVITEKPMALDLKGADAMLAAAKKADKKLMVAQVLRFFPEFKLIKDLADSGKYGKIIGAHFKRIGAKPTWGYEDWFLYVEKSGGMAFDMHIHDADFVRHLFGMPQAVSAVGAVGPQGEVDYVVVQYFYGKERQCITAQGGTIAVAGLAFEHGYDVFFERATLQMNLTGLPKPTIYLPNGKKQEVKYKPGDGYQMELQYAAECLNKGCEPELLSAASARDTVALVLKEIESVKKGRPVKVA